MFKTRNKVYFFDFPVTRKYANGITTRVSKIEIQTNKLKYKGFENPSNATNSFLNASKVISANSVEENRLTKAVEITFPLSFSLLKNRKKAVSIP